MPKTARQMEKIIKMDGWYFVSSKGAHRKYKHPTKKGIVIISFHPGDLKKGTENKILKEAQIGGE